MSDEPGRPPASDSEIETVLQKLRPYLEQGFSVEKSRILAGISNGTVYNFMTKHDWFLERIEAYKNHKPVLISSIFTWRLNFITEKLKSGQNYLLEAKKNNLSKVVIDKELKDIMPNRDEWEFVEWLAQFDKTARDLFGMRQELTGKDGEPLINGKLDEEKKKEVSAIVAERLASLNKQNEPTNPKPEPAAVPNGPANDPGTGNAGSPPVAA